MLFKNVQDKGDMLVVHIPKTKAENPRTFIITQEFYPRVKKYINLGLKNCLLEIFFLGCRNGKCINQPIGINLIGHMPKVVETYLQLENADNY